MITLKGVKIKEFVLDIILDFTSLSHLISELGLAEGIEKA